MKIYLWGTTADLDRKIENSAYLEINELILSVQITRNKRRMNRMSETFRYKHIDTYINSVGKRKEKQAKEYLNKTMVKIFPNLVKNINLHIQEAHSKKTTLCHTRRELSPEIDDVGFLISDFQPLEL